MLEPGPDRERTYSSEEEQLLTERLAALTTAVYRGDDGPVTDRTRLCALHRQLFHGIRSHAGRARDRDVGTEYLVFGPNRSVSRDEVHAELHALFADLRRSLESFRDHPIDATYVAGGLYVAAWAHAEVVRIHPFEDGNGRTSRLLLGSILVALRLPPLAMEVVKQEYNAALNHYFAARREADRRGSRFDGRRALEPLCALMRELLARRATS